MWTRLRLAVSRLTFALACRRLDDDARLEIDSHLELLTARFERQGLAPGDAWLAARRQFGSVLGVRQEVHDMNGIGWMERLAGDLRDAVRQVRRSPGYATTVALTLGLGIGGATAVFSVVDAVLLAPLPYQEPGRLVRLHQQQPGRADTRSVLTATHFSFVRDHAGSFEELAALAHYAETGVDLAGRRGVERLRVLRVSSGYFETLGASLALGRGFSRDDEAGAGTRRVVLSDSVWRAHFAADPAVVGSTVRLSAEAYEIAGVTAPGFVDPFAPDVALWTPYPLARDTYEENYSLTAIGRLRDGVSLDRATAELATLDEPMRARWPAADRYAIVAVPLHEELVARARGPLQLVFAAVAVVLLIACVNVANLALVRATGRVHEFAVRATLGSGRAGLARQLLAETLLLAGLGGLFGLGVASAGIRVLRRLGRDALPRLDDVGIDGTVLLFALAATGLTAVIFGTLPVLRLAGAAPVQSLRQQSRSATGGRGLARLRGGLAAAQVALALHPARGRGDPAGRLLAPPPGRSRLPLRPRAGAGGPPADRALRRAAPRRLPGGNRPARRSHPRRARSRRHLAPAGDGQLPPLEHADPIGTAGRHAARPGTLPVAAAVRVWPRLRRTRHPRARRSRLRRPRHGRRAHARRDQRQLRAHGLPRFASRRGRRSANRRQWPGNADRRRRR